MLTKEIKESEVKRIIEFIDSSKNQLFNKGVNHENLIILLPYWVFRSILFYYKEFFGASEIENVLGAKILFHYNENEIVIYDYLMPEKYHYKTIINKEQ